MLTADLLCPQCIELHGRSGTKTEVIGHLIDLVMKSGKISDREAFEKTVFQREQEISTGIGDGIGIPHGICSGVDSLVLSAMVIPGGTDFEAIDHRPVDLLFMIVIPSHKRDMYLHFLSRISRYLLQDKFTRALRRAPSAEEFIRVFRREIPARQFKFENVS